MFLGQGVDASIGLKRLAEFAFCRRRFRWVLASRDGDDAVESVKPIRPSGKSTPLSFRGCAQGLSPPSMATAVRSLK
jgi:hypothetical protein